VQCLGWIDNRPESIINYSCKVCGIIGTNFACVPINILPVPGTNVRIHDLTYGSLLCMYLHRYVTKQYNSTQLLTLYNSAYKTHHSITPKLTSHDPQLLRYVSSQNQNLRIRDHQTTMLLTV